MILGNKCDMEDKRVIHKEKGESVSNLFLLYCVWFFVASFVLYVMEIVRLL